MRIWLVWLLSVVGLIGAETIPPGPSPIAAPALKAAPKTVCIIPIKTEIGPPLVYVIRRGVKEAIEKEADLLVLDMDTPGGMVATTFEILKILNEFKGETATYVNKAAFSAGSFIAAGTRKIYMAPGSVIGAAAPIMISPEGQPQSLPDTIERKQISGLRAMVRTSAEKHGHNAAVFEAMIDKTKGLTIDGVVIAKEGEILTLTNTEAEKEYGTPPKKLLSAGTFASLDALLKETGYGSANRLEIIPTGMEKIGSWLNALRPLLLMIGLLGLYMEFKAPGMGVPGVVGACALVLFFAGGYVAGLSGFEWVLLFILGLALIFVDLFLFPGTFVLGLAGAGLVLIAIIMAMVDLYPTPGPGPSLPRLPSFDVFSLPIRQLAIAMAGAAVGIWLLSRILPKTHLYQSVVSTSVSGTRTEIVQEQQRSARQGQTGVALSTLRPGGKAQFGEEILDVMTQGEMIAKGTPVRILRHSGSEAVVEALPGASA
jgi:membrane-bound serine protease (ClpP class)